MLHASQKISLATSIPDFTFRSLCAPVNGFTASAYQSAILAWAETRSGDLLVKAAAGSAKSTTLVEALRLAPGLDQDKIALTFNKHIEKDLKHKLKGDTDRSPNHSFGRIPSAEAAFRRRIATRQQQ